MAFATWSARCRLRLAAVPRGTSISGSVWQQRQCHVAVCPSAVWRWNSRNFTELAATLHRRQVLVLEAPSAIAAGAPISVKIADFGLSQAYTTRAAARSETGEGELVVSRSVRRVAVLILVTDSKPTREDV